jgi:hypothetical protein
MVLLFCAVKVMTNYKILIKIKNNDLRMADYYDWSCCRKPRSLKGNIYAILTIPSLWCQSSAGTRASFHAG